MGNYRNRIVGLEYVSSAELLPHPGNWREHGKAQVDALRGVLAEVGIADALLAYRSERAGGKLTVIDGHLRKDAAPQVWPVLILDVTDAEADYILATHDPLAAMAQADAAALDALLVSVNSGEAAVQQMLADLAAEAGLYTNEPKAVADVEPQIDRAEELRRKWRVESGDLWILGEHRIICGDCTDPAVVARVMGGERAEMFLTDPPYGVSYADKNEWLNSVAFGNRIQTPIENDHGSIEDTAKKIWLPAFSCAFECCSDTASFYLFMPQGGDQMMMMMMMNEAGWMPRHELIWLKNNHVLGRADYNYKHEPILYGWKRKGTHHFYGDFQVSVIECDKPQNSDLHPTMKPLELIVRLIPNNTQPGEVVYDPFSGSGTTILACEATGRKARAVEISPAYVAVTLQRWADATGREPVRAASGLTQ